MRSGTGGVGSGSGGGVGSGSGGGVGHGVEQRPQGCTAGPRRPRRVALFAAAQRAAVRGREGAGLRAPRAVGVGSPAAAWSDERLLCPCGGAADFLNEEAGRADGAPWHRGQAPYCTRGLTGLSTRGKRQTTAGSLTSL